MLFEDKTIGEIKPCDAFTPIEWNDKINSRKIKWTKNDAGVITGPMSEEARNTLRKVLFDEVHRKDMLILENVDFVHRTPMAVLPMGAMCEIDCEKKTFSILESGVR